MKFVITNASMKPSKLREIEGVQQIGGIFTKSFDTLEELVQFSRDIGEPVIITPFEDYTEILIYDGYIE